MKLHALGALFILVGALLLSYSVQAMPPAQMFPITDYPMITELASPSPVHKKIATLILNYNKRFLNAQNVLMAKPLDQSDAASKAFTALQEQTITELRALNTYQPLFTVTNNDNLKIDLFAIQDENKELVAIGLEKVYFSGELSRSTLRIRPVSSLVGGQTIQDAFDFSAFVMDTPVMLDPKTGGVFVMKYATNVSLASKPALKDRKWADLKWELKNVNGVWNVETNRRAIKAVIVGGGVLGGIKLKEIKYKN
ncbi:MAG: hypothetical protein V4736_13655 [Bdellovibrionota bacterium]